MSETRDYWIETLLRISSPVFTNLANDSLREKMPVETAGDPDFRRQFTHLEALGRSLAGVGPWLDSPKASDAEELKKSELQQMVCASVKIATDKNAKDFMNFTTGKQPIVDAAFLAQGLLRSWDSVWCQLDEGSRRNIVECLEATRVHKAFFNNWLLFPAMIEAFLYKAGAEWDRARVDYAIRQHEQWYKGDGIYGDGPDFHWDYYNSFVILPMLYDIVNIGGDIAEEWASFREPINARIQRYAAIQERLIGVDGSFPPIGRSLAYRFGAFQALALVAFKSKLPSGLSPAAVRCALTAVIKRLFERDDVFDEDGWLRVGFCGHQPSIGEPYVSTGSLYLCLCGFLPLGLPVSDPFWAGTDEDWTSKRIWNGEDYSRDQPITG